MDDLGDHRFGYSDPNDPRYPKARPGMDTPAPRVSAAMVEVVMDHLLGAFCIAPSRHTAHVVRAALIKALAVSEGK